MFLFRIYDKNQVALMSCFSLPHQSLKLRSKEWFALEENILLRLNVHSNIIPFFILPPNFPQMHRPFLWKKYTILLSNLFWTHESKSHIMSPFFPFLPFARNLFINLCECKIHILPKNKFLLHLSLEVIFHV